MAGRARGDDPVRVVLDVHRHARLPDRKPEVGLVVGDGGGVELLLLRVNAELAARVHGLGLALGSEVVERRRLDSEQLGVLLEVLLRRDLSRVGVGDDRLLGGQAADDSLLVGVYAGLRRGVVVLVHPGPFRSLASLELSSLEGCWSWTGR